MRILFATVLMAAPLAAFAAGSNPDESFFKKAADAGLTEVQAGQDAQANGSSQSVKDFGAMMVKDHGAANTKLMAIASKKGVELPTEPGMMHKAMKKKMDMKSGASFDKDYVAGQIKAHKQTIALLNEEIANGKDADAKAFATETLPKVQMHLDKINQIAGTMGVN